MSVTPLAKSLLVAILICASVFAQTPAVVYETSTNYSGQFLQTANEYGDEITLLGNKRFITQIQIEYFGKFTPNGDEVARLRFYQNTGPNWMGHRDYPTPASPPLWETTFPVGLGFNTATIAVPNVQVPLNFTWTVQFFGIEMTATDHAGLLIYGDPIVGTSWKDYWELRPEGWVPMQIQGQRVNFACKILALDAAPLPPSLTTTIDGNSLRLSWPAATATGFYLESRPAVDSGVWAPVLPIALRVGDFYQITIPIEAGNRLFRLNTKPQPPLLISAQNGSVRLRWSSAVGGQIVQTKTSAASSTWTDVPTPSRPNGDFYEVTVPTSSDMQFFRLVKKF
jgi:hypothetical protein